MKNKLEYNTLYYALIGDTIGFGNGNTSSNNFNDMKCTNNNEAYQLSGWTSYHIFDFISKGSYSGFKLNDYIISEAGMFMLAVYDALSTTKLKKYESNTIVDNIIIRIMEYYNNDKKKSKRFYDDNLIEKLRDLSEADFNYNTFSYNEDNLGSEPLVRGIPLALKYNNDIEKLLELSIETTRITNNNPTSYIGTFATALFISLAIKKIDPNKWIDELLNYFIDGNINDYIKNKIKTNKKEIRFHFQDLVEYQYLLNNYKESRFDKKTNKFLPSNNGGSKYLMFLPDRIFYFYSKFGSPGNFNPGSNGLDCLLIAYDSFMECDSNFEKLIYLSMLHAGKSNYTGCIAGALFGAYYGEKKLPDNLSKIEVQDKLNKLIN